MALGNGNEYEAAANNDFPPTMADQNGFGKEGYYGNFSSDPEKQGGAAPGERKMSRIDRPVTRSISGVQGGGVTADDSTDSSESVGKQMELEAGNAIKYRTCSWYKV